MATNKPKARSAPPAAETDSLRPVGEAGPELEVASAQPLSGRTQLRVRAVHAGFRRAGREWSAAEVTVPADEFSAEQIAQLLAEPLLVVTTIETAGE